MEDALHSDHTFGRFVLTFWRPTPASARFAIALAWIVCAFLFWHSANLFGIPTLRGFDGSIFCDASPAVGVIVVAVLLLICTVLGTVIAGAIHFEAGFFAAALGMAMISMRSGTVRSVIYETGAKVSVFYTLAAELAVLGILLAGAWALLVFMKKFSDPQVSGEKPNFVHGLSALGVQIAGTGIVVCILAQNEAKNQALASVFIASILGAVAAYMSFPTRPGYWYWAGPIIVGIVGYLIAAGGGASSVANGTLEGTLVALARPLPVDYASVGPAGAILGYWMARGWAEEEK